MLSNSLVIWALMVTVHLKSVEFGALNVSWVCGDLRSGGNFSSNDAFKVCVYLSSEGDCVFKVWRFELWRWLQWSCLCCWCESVSFLFLSVHWDSVAHWGGFSKTRICLFMAQRKVMGQQDSGCCQSAWMLLVHWCLTRTMRQKDRRRAEGVVLQPPTLPGEEQ